MRWAVEQAEERFAFSRVGGRGRTVKVDVAAAVFPHHTNRHLESQIHSHAFVINLGVDDKGKTRALASPPLFDNRDLLGSIYRSRLAWLLHSMLGLELERDGFSFRIKGVPQEPCDAHSTRRKEIEELVQWLAKERGVPVDGKLAAEAALITQAKKDDSVSLSDLLVQWQKLDEQYGFTAEKALGLLDRYKAKSDRREAKAAVEEAIDDLMAKGNHFSGREFLEEVLNAGAARNVADAVLLEIAPRYLKEGDLELLGIPPGETTGFYTTTKILKEERRLLDAAYKLRGRKPRRVVNDRIFRKVIAKRKTISQEQEDAVQHLLQTPGSIRLVDGFAGTFPWPATSSKSWMAVSLIARR